MDPDSIQSRAAFHELLALLERVDERFYGGPNALIEPADVLDGYRRAPACGREVHRGPAHLPAHALPAGESPKRRASPA